MRKVLHHTYIYKVLALVLLLVGVQRSMAQQFPPTEGNRLRYNVLIDIKKAYISGVCLMLTEEGVVKASIVNEFGVSAMDFTYSPEKDKVKIVSVMSKLNKWYIRKLLKKDLREVMHCLKEGKTHYDDVKFSISYTFTPAETPIGNESSTTKEEQNETTE